MIPQTELFVFINCRFIGIECPIWKKATKYLLTQAKKPKSLWGIWKWFVHTKRISIKVQFSWEGHKNVRNRPYGFEIYLVNVKTIRTIAQIFVAFSEKLNFKLSNSSNNFMNSVTTNLQTFSTKRNVVIYIHNTWE